MAYILKKQKNRNQSITYQIFEMNRIPGTKNRFASKSVEKFNSLELAEKGVADPEAYALSHLADWKGLAAGKAASKTANVSIDMTTPWAGAGNERVNDVKNLGYSVYSHFYHLLQLDYLINARRQHTDARFNANVILQHLVYSRCLWPDSKRGTWTDRDRFYGDTDYTLDDVYRCLDDILMWRGDILKHLNEQIRERFGRQETILYYDVTNYYFEIDRNDEDPAGLRAAGVSKEHRKTPIVQMGLFMDELGIPITYDLYRGNTADSLTFYDALDKAVIDFSGKRKILVADKGMLCFKNILKVRNDRNGYVISQSIRKSDADTVAFAMDEDGWTGIEDDMGDVVFRYKERYIPRKASTYGDVDAKKHSGTYNERQVFIWSKKYADRSKHQREEVIEKAKEYAGTKSADFKETSHGKHKYTRKKPVNSDGVTEDVDSFVVEYDEEAVKRDEELDGYYVIVTNVDGLAEGEKADENKSPDYSYYNKEGFLKFNRAVPATEIIDIYGGLWKIEETFKVTKTGMLNTRPVFHQKDERIRAHFLICFISLVLERILEREVGWKYSARTIQEELGNLNYFRIADSNINQIAYYSTIAQELMMTAGINLTHKYIRQNELRSLLAETKK